MTKETKWVEVAADLETGTAVLEKHDVADEWTVHQPALATFKAGNRQIQFNAADVDGRHFIAVCTLIRGDDDVWVSRSRTLIQRRQFWKFAAVVAQVLRQVIAVYEAERANGKERSGASR